MTDLINAPLHVFAPALPIQLARSQPGLGEAKAKEKAAPYTMMVRVWALNGVPLGTAYADSIGKSNLNHRLPAVV
jgi:hypothetical protein